MWTVEAISLYLHQNWSNQSLAFVRQHLSHNVACHSLQTQFNYSIVGENFWFQTSKIGVRDCYCSNFTTQVFEDSGEKKNEL